MIFDSGQHAISWLVNEADSLSQPATITEHIVGILQGTVPMGDSTFTYDDDEKHHAKMDLRDLLESIGTMERRLLLRFVIDGRQAAVAHLKTGEEWKEWRETNSSNLSCGRVTYSGKIYAALDEWERLLVANDYATIF